MYYHNADAEYFAALYGRLDRESLATEPSPQGTVSGQSAMGSLLALLVLLGTAVGIVAKPQSAAPGLTDLSTEHRTRL